MKYILPTWLLIMFCMYSYNLNAQVPNAKLWDYRYGGNDGERLTCFLQTADRGFILGGYSSSNISGDKTQNTNGGFDYYVVKTDKNGIIQWEKDYGGAGDDLLYSVNQCNDGGYIIGGLSYSGISGDKTQDTYGNSDYWVIKVNSIGVIQWDRDFGGDNIESLYSAKQTSDGGYIFGGYSYSGISGNKTTASLGQKDYWIVKTDTAGLITWDKSYGGIDDDWFYDMQQTTDSGYILGGFSNSNISGDKTQMSQGGYDFWIVKTDQNGTTQWDKDFGGNNIDGLFSLHQTNDGGYILGGSSISNTSGDKSQDSWGAYDYWIIKVDSAGTKQWDKDYGGTLNEEVFGNITQTTDSGFLAAGLSYSGVGGDKTEANLGLEQVWIVKTDATGNKQWDKTIFTTGEDETGMALQTSDGCYVVSTFSSAGIGGYKSQPAWNNSDDYLIIKLCDSALIAGVHNPVQNSTFSIRPNPNTGSFEVALNLNQNNFSDAHYFVTIANAQGKTVLTLNSKASTFKIDFPFSRGIYFLFLHDDKGNVIYRDKFMKM